MYLFEAFSLRRHPLPQKKRITHKVLRFLYALLTSLTQEG